MYYGWLNSRPLPHVLVVVVHMLNNIRLGTAVFPYVEP